MKKHTFLFLLLLFSFLVCYSQKQGNIWYFGDHAGLDFNNNPPSPLMNGKTDFSHPVIRWNEGCSSISDSSGSLLFYTNGEKIWNKQHQIMPNGDSLMGHSSSTQSSIIVPQPWSSRYFYVFTTDAQENNFQNGLRYNVVDICLDGGLGDVIPNQKNIKLLDTVAEKLICIRHSNGNDYWIITHKFNTDAFYSFRLTNTGIINTIISSTGTIDLNGVGQMIASPNGQRIVYAITTAQTSSKNFLVDFNTSTGVVSNEQILSSGGRVYGVSFSPDNTKLYCSTIGVGDLYQYNLNTGNLSAIIASQTYIKKNGPDGWRQHQLGPDGKIYISWTGKSYLSIIEYPNSLCPACSYIDSAIYLGGQNTSFGLPNLISSYDYSNKVYNCALPICLFASSDSSLCAEGSNCIDFFDYSTNNPTNWKWIFIGGIPGTSTLQNPLNICYPTPGSYAVQLIVSNSNGSDTTTYFNMIKVGNTPVPFNVIVSGNALTSASSGSAYQWFFNGLPIAGATDSSYTATMPGNYSVMITDGFGCTRLSNGVWASVNELNGGGGVTIYPNPVGSVLWVEGYGLRVGTTTVEIKNVIGERVLQSEIMNLPDGQAGPKCEINISALAKGVYIVEVRSRKGVFRAKFVKE